MPHAIKLCPHKVKIKAGIMGNEHITSKSTCYVPGDLREDRGVKHVSCRYAVYVGRSDVSFGVDESDKLIKHVAFRVKADDGYLNNPVAGAGEKTRSLNVHYREPAILKRCGGCHILLSAKESPKHIRPRPANCAICCKCIARDRALSTKRESAERANPSLPGFKGCPLIFSNFPRAGGWEQPRSCCGDNPDAAHRAQRPCTPCG